MIDNALSVVAYIGILLLAGLLCSILSRKLKIPNLLLLIAAGILFSSIRYNNQPIFEIPSSLLISLAVITLALVAFDSTSTFRFREFDSLSSKALKLSLIFLILNMIFLSIATQFIFSPSSILLSIIFAAVVSGTDPSATMFILSGARSKIFEFLKIESVLNTPLTVLIPFLLVDVLNNPNISFNLNSIISQISPFTLQFVSGIGSGVIIALIFFRFMKKYYSETLSSLTVIIVALLSYTLAEYLGGNGVLSVTTAGLMFGNLYHVKNIRKLQKFGEIFSDIFEILVFILLGFVIQIPWSSLQFMLPATFLFFIFVFIRFIAVSLSFPTQEYNLKEKLYMTLNIPSGIAMAVVALTLAAKSLIGVNIILDLIFLFLIYSLLLSTVVTHFTKYFTKIELKENN